MNTFYISDLHFYHKNIINLCDRPYETIEEMNEDIIEKWNSVVTSDDVVRILGDIAFPKSQDEVDKIIQIVKRLNGNKTLIVGNHDWKLLKNEKFIKLFSSIENYMMVKDNGRKVILFHYPIEEWDGYYRDSIHLYGHVHNNNVGLKEIKNRYNVSADVIGFTPKTLDELIELNSKTLVND